MNVFIKKYSYEKLGRRVLFGIIALLGSIFIIGLILAFLPAESKTKRAGISPETAARLRQNFADSYHQFTTSDGETLFLRRWNPDSIEPAKKEIAVLIFHGIMAYSGPYDMAGKPLVWA